MERRILLAAGVLLPFASAKAASHPKHPVDKKPYHPPYSEIVVSSKSGVIYGNSASMPIRPASLVKMMTLHLLFSFLDSGKITLSSMIRFSANAASNPSTHLGLQEGASLSIGDAISALCVHSCNDVAVAVAEMLSGTEDAFVKNMNEEARKLGLLSTRFGNASGLPHPDNISTAYDLLLLGIGVLNRHPNYAGYMGLRSWSYADKIYANTNKLLASYDGMDAGKTGYIAESGFNLFASAFRNGRRVAAVITGGATSAIRDNRMEKLLDMGFI